MFEQLNMQHTEISGGGYGYFNYALLHGTGLHHIFDTMRYERAFFVRETDVQCFLEAAQNYTEWATRRYAILLCKYDFKGKTKPNWTPQRLLSNQELEIITDPLQLLQLGANDVSLRPPKKLKVQHLLPLEGPVAWLLQVMFLNKAMPSSEPDAHKIERAFFDSGTPAVTLTNFCVSKTLWNLPPKELWQPSKN